MEEREKKEENEKIVECFGSLRNRLAVCFNRLLFGMLSNRRWSEECFGMFFMGVCRLIGRVLSVACGKYPYVACGRVSVAWETAGFVF